MSNRLNFGQTNLEFQELIWRLRSCIRNHCYSVLNATAITYSGLFYTFHIVAPKPVDVSGTASSCQVRFSWHIYVLGRNWEDARHIRHDTWPSLTNLNNSRTNSGRGSKLLFASQMQIIKTSVPNEWTSRNSAWITFDETSDKTLHLKPT